MRTSPIPTTAGSTILEFIRAKADFLRSNPAWIGSTTQCKTAEKIAALLSREDISIAAVQKTKLNRR